MFFRISKQIQTTCRQTRGDLSDIARLNRSYLKNNSRSQSDQRAHSLDWQHGGPMGSQQGPREALLKIPPPGSRAPADGGFPLAVLNTRGAGEGSARSGLEAKQQSGGLLHRAARAVVSERTERTEGIKHQLRAAERGWGRGGALLSVYEVTEKTSVSTGGKTFQQLFIHFLVFFTGC